MTNKKTDDFSNIGDATHVDNNGDLYFWKCEDQNAWALSWTVNDYWGTSVFKNFELRDMDRFTKIDKGT